MDVYLVGGAVRDELLGLPVTERDWVVVGSTPDEMRSLGYRPVGKDFPVFLHPESKEEYALARTERKKGRGYHGFEIHASPDVSLEDDLLRRDLTINAMAKNAQGEIIDPYGGRKDLENKILRHVSDAFVEDPLRVLRVARFAAKYHHMGFKIDKETHVLMRQIVTCGELREIALERIWQETTKALRTDAPGEFFQVLENTHALSQVYPAFHHTFIDEKNRVHGLTALETICKSYPDANIRFATMIGGLHYEGKKNNMQNIKKFSQEFPLPNNVKKLLHAIISYQHECHNALKLSAEELLRLINYLDARRNPERFKNILEICEAIYNSINKTQHYKQKQFLLDAATAIENINIDAWVQAKVSAEELMHNIKQAQLSRLEKLISKFN